MRVRLTQVLAFIAVAELLVGLSAITIAWMHAPVEQLGAPLNSLRMSAALTVAYGAIGVLLPVLVRADSRARELGMYLLLVAVAFSHVLTRSGFQFGPVNHIVLRTRIQIFLPVYLWMFVRDFPIRLPLGRFAMWPQRLVKLSASVAAAIFLIDIAVDLRGAYWGILTILMMPAAPILIERSRHVGPGDRRRVLLFVGAISAGLLPIAADVFLRAASPAWREFAGRRPWIPNLVLGALLTVPFTTAYSVVVDRVFDLRLVARAALQYALARITIIALILVPLLWALWSAFEARSQTIAQVVAQRPLPLCTAAFSLVVVLPRRQRLLGALDRRFFREHYDTDLILSALVDASRTAKSASQLAQLLASEIDQALHPYRLAVLVHGSTEGRFDPLAGQSRSLPVTSLLVDMLGGSDQPLEIDPLNTRSILNRLDSDTVVWVADGDFRILVPLRGASGSLRGIIALGERKSELPYSSRDRHMLAIVGATAGLCLDAYPETGQSETPAARNLAFDSEAMECPQCGLVYPSSTLQCQCGESTVRSSVPEVLGGKFRMLQRIGAGGMGVVYRATDLALDRTVAVKALRGARAHDAWRLRREARAMALVTHPNLAVLFGLEFWFGRPFLAVEFLGGGTLADRISTEHRLPEPVVARIGLAIASALEVLHRADILHRDIKPANIGFTADGVVKLLDFGLARQIDAADTVTVTVGGETDMPPDWLALPGHTPTGRIIGTPSYMSREALANEKADVGFDLWSLGVTLFEALAGVNPYRERRLADLLKPAPAPDPRSYLSELGEGTTAFFATALAPLRADRPGSAQTFASLISRHLSM